MEILLPTIVNVFIASSMYILVTLGFAFIFNMLGILNLAHGAIYMIGAYITYEFAFVLGMNSWAALLMSTVIVGLFGLFLEKYMFRRFVGNFNLAIAACIAVTVILQTAVNIMLGTKVTAIPPFVNGFFKAGLISASYDKVATFLVGGMLMGVMLWSINNTKWGQQMQAIAQDREGAYLQGINVNRVSAIACAIGCALAAVAGSMLGALLNITPFMGDYVLVKILIIVILAGAGSLGGIVITGLILSAVGTVLPLMMKAEIAEAVIISVVVVLLLFRPRGFFGHET